MTSATDKQVGGATLRAGQVAETAGVNRETLRYYERRGLLPQPGRSPGGHRLYPQEAVTVLRVIKAAQRLGFTLDEVDDLLRMGQHRHGKKVDAGLQARSRTKLGEIDARIADLNTIRANLLTALDAGCDDLNVCATTDCCPLPFVDIASHSEALPVRLRLRDRHLYGAGAAACAVCCAPPVLALLGIAGAGIAATIATAAFAGIVFALVVAGATVFALVQRKRRGRKPPEAACPPEQVTLDLGPTRRT